MVTTGSDKKLNLKSVGVALHHLSERLGPPSKGWSDANVYKVGSRVFAGKREADERGITTAEAHSQRIEAKLFGDLFGSGPNTQD